MQPLDGAYQRARRARIHLANLKKRIRVFRQVIDDSIVIDRKPALIRLPNGREVKGVIGNAHFRLEPPPPVISILVGEIIYNLRAALDYLIYELAKFDSKKVIQGTQFPIDDLEDVFKGRGNNFLKGVSNKHIAIIEGLQPCYGCDWMKVLRGISNPDKHRELTIINRGVALSILPGSTEAIIAGQAVNVKDGVSINIAFSDGTPVIETLEQLHSEITKVLNLFKPEFK